MGKIFSFSFLLQALVVIFAVLAFSYFDPFDVLVSNKLTLRDTPAQVQQIKSIGELISAEYYGEVISSKLNSEQADMESAKRQAEIDIKNLHELFKSCLKKLIDEDPEGKPEIRKYLETMIDSLIRNKYGKEYFDKFDSAVGKRKMIRQIKNYLGDEKVKTDFITYLASNDYKLNYYNDAIEKVNESIEKEFSKEKKKNSQLILIGRGKVQAGFKFDSLTSRNVKVDTLRNRIILVGLKPQILSCDINPWFIPELGIKGFEIVEFSRNADKIETLKRVKKNCLDSLRNRAIKSDILIKAKENAEQNLKNLFILLLNNKDIEVKIVADSSVLKADNN